MFFPILDRIIMNMGKKFLEKDKIPLDRFVKCH